MKQQEYLEKRESVINNPKIVFIKANCRICDYPMSIQKELRDNICENCKIIESQQKTCDFCNSERRIRLHSHGKPLNEYTPCGICNYKNEVFNVPLIDKSLEDE